MQRTSTQHRRGKGRLTGCVASRSDRGVALEARENNSHPIQDLFEGLPGVATDVLAERLRAMEAAGVVRQRTVKHPVPAKV